MKILFTGGGTGGHFYPIIAVAEAVTRITDERKIANVSLHYFSNDPYDREALFNNRITYGYTPAGKLRIYFSLRNILDIFTMGFGVLVALWKVFNLYPDVVFAKGGFGSFPTLMAARILGIPVIIHESDSAPGRVTRWAGKFARYIGLSYAECATYFPAGKTARVGQPVRSEIEHVTTTGVFEFLELESNIPVLFIIGGSSGAQIINNCILEALPHLIEKYQIIHQTGKANHDGVLQASQVILENNELQGRYKPIAFLSPLQMRMAGGAADLVISRAGSGIFEIASWGKPAVIIPISSSNNDHQRKNAYNYARANAGTVIEESNLTPSVLHAEVNRIIEDPVLTMQMQQAAKAFYVPHAADKIAEKIIEIGLSHEE